MAVLNHYPHNEKHAADQFADPSRINSDAYRDGWERIFGDVEKVDLAWRIKVSHSRVMPDGSLHRGEGPMCPDCPPGKQS